MPETMIAGLDFTANAEELPATPRLTVADGGKAWLLCRHCRTWVGVTDAGCARRHRRFGKPCDGGGLTILDAATPLDADGEPLEQDRNTATERSRAAKPQPRITGTGVGICVTSCTMFSLHDDATKAGRCLSGHGHPTRAGVPCFPWVEHFVNEHKTEVQP